MEKGDRIIHLLHGPCLVTFIGAGYVGIRTDDGRDALLKKDPDSIVPWSEEREAAWRNSIEEELSAEQEEEKQPWPESTFSHEPDDVSHYLGSHWAPFFDESANDLLKELPDILRTAVVVKGVSESASNPRQLPVEWAKGFHLAWPNSDKGVILTVRMDEIERQNRLISIYPFWQEGSRHRLVINNVSVWDEGVEAQITAGLGDVEITFFDAHFLLNRGWYERGKECEFSLCGLAYTARPAEDIEIPFTPNPDQVAWEAELARSRGEEFVRTPETISLRGAAFLLPIDKWDVDDYSFRGPIKQVRPFRDFLGQDGWVVTATILRLSNKDPEDVDLNILITKRVWETDSPPVAGQDIEGRFWLQGFLKSTEGSSI